MLITEIIARRKESYTTLATDLARIKHGIDLNVTHQAPNKTQILPNRYKNDSAERQHELVRALLHVTVGSNTSSPISASSNPQSEPESEPENGAESRSEPEPDWSKAYEEWGAAWEIHVYLFGFIFLGFAIYSAYFIGMALYTGLNQKYLGFCLNIMMLILGFSRAFVLFTDPYMQGTTINNTQVLRSIWVLGIPCLTSADCLLILTLVEKAKISVAPNGMQKFSAIIKVIVFHFVLVIFSEFIVSQFIAAKALLVVCQAFFIVWGTMLGVGYFILAYKLDRKLFGHKEVKSKKDILYIRLIYASGVNNLIQTVVYIYSSASEFGVYSDAKFISAWSWWILQTFNRVVEVVSGVLIFTVSAKRRSLIKNRGNKREVEVNHISGRHFKRSVCGRWRRFNMLSNFQSAKKQVTQAETSLGDIEQGNEVLKGLSDTKIQIKITGPSDNQLVVGKESKLSMLSYPVEHDAQFSIPAEDTIDNLKGEIEVTNTKIDGTSSFHHHSTAGKESRG